MAKTTAQILANWQKGMAAAGPAYVQGTGATTSNPMQLAAAQAQKAVQNYSNSLTSGQWAAKLNATPVSYWKSQCAGAAQKLAMGAQKGGPKYQAAIQALQPIYAADEASAQGCRHGPRHEGDGGNQCVGRGGKEGQGDGRWLMIRSRSNPDRISRTADGWATRAFVFGAVFFFWRQPMDTLDDKRQDMLDAIQRVGNYVQEIAEHRQLRNPQAAPSLASPLTRSVPSAASSRMS